MKNLIEMKIRNVHSATKDISLTKTVIIIIIIKLNRNIKIIIMMIMQKHVTKLLQLQLKRN